jgi:hypothetical protein
MGRADARRQRCAIYTRKSSEEGLEQDGLICAPDEASWHLARAALLER